MTFNPPDQRGIPLDRQPARLRRPDDPGKPAAMAKCLKAAGTTTPTRTRPGVESGARNAAIGPFADRVRDAVRSPEKGG